MWPGALQGRKGTQGRLLPHLHHSDAGVQNGKPMCPRKGNRAFFLENENSDHVAPPPSKALKQSRRTAPLRFSISL